MAPTHASGPDPTGPNDLPAVSQPGGLERMLTSGPKNHWLMPFGPFSPDGRRLVCDTRTEDGAMGQNPDLETVGVDDGRTQLLYRVPHQTPDGPGCGTPSFSPIADRVVFIHGLLNCGPGRPYGGARRAAAVIDARPAPTDAARPADIAFLDGRDLTPPFTPGALRGGTHAHEWSGDGHFLGFTYNDAVMAELGKKTGRDLDLRSVGVCADLGPVKVRPRSDGENHDGLWTCALVSRVTPEPAPGSDQLRRAFENCWVGRQGYLRPDGRRQRAQAFLGETRAADGRPLVEVFIADVPDRIDVPGPHGPLPGTETDFPQPPAGVVQRRLTHTEGREHPGVATEPRHWLAASPDGDFIAFLARDDQGLIQVFLVRPQGGEPIQLTKDPGPAQSSIAWAPNGRRLAYVADNSLFAARVGPDGRRLDNLRLTTPAPNHPLNPAWSPDARAIAYNRDVPLAGARRRQIFLLRLDPQDR